MKKLLMIGLPRSSYSRHKCLQEAFVNGIKLYVAEQKEYIIPYKEELDKYNVEMIVCKEIDLDYLASIITKEHINNVFSLTEFQLENASKLREKLNLSGDYSQVVRSTRNKYRTRVHLDKQNLNNIKYNACTYDELLKVYREDMPAQCIIKPVDLTGSIGIQKVNSEEDIRDYIEFCKTHEMLKVSDIFLLEEYIEGKEVSVEGIVIKGTFYMFGVTEKFNTSEPYFMEIGHRIPMNITDAGLENEIFEYVNDCIKALNINQSPIHAELILSKKGPILVEIHTRYGGDNINQLLFNAYGINIYELYYKALLEEQVQYCAHRCKSICQIKFFSTEDGYIEEIHIDKSLKKRNDIIDLTFYKNIGQYVESYPHRFARVGHILFRAEDYNTLQLLDQEIEKKIKVNVVKEIDCEKL